MDFFFCNISRWGDKAKSFFEKHRQTFPVIGLVETHLSKAEMNKIKGKFQYWMELKAEWPQQERKPPEPPDRV